VDGALTTHKIRGETRSRCGHTPTAATLHVQSRLEIRLGAPARDRNPFVYSVSLVAIRLRTAKGW
jgi:hypothetical protein